ncbi:hypothetical protein P3T36_005007 [Kitasatospora sp. MAP12-15]|nr:hypothetical protein [Kitasatospora sp. MAP12-44]MDH6112016.1 hypothetical protein [Kitasatospora sp. MAP12-44]
MVQDTTSAPAAEGGLLVAARKIAAARARTEVPSDVTSGKSDGND